MKRHENDDTQAWELLASVLPDPGTVAEWASAAEFAEESDCVMWAKDGNSWYLPADVFVWVAT
jgi:hypothetical protein